MNNTDKSDSAIEVLKDLDRLIPITDILCPAKKAPTPVKRVTGRMAQPGEVASIWPFTGETRKPEQVPLLEPIQKQIQPQKHVVHAGVHALMEPPEPEAQLESQISDKALDQVGYLPTPKDLV